MKTPQIESETMQFAPEIIIKLSLAMGMFIYLAPNTKLINGDNQQQDAKSDAINNPH